MLMSLQYLRKHQRLEPSNYRPVSLTSTVYVAKSFESLVRDDLMELLLRNKLPRDSQHGFMSKKICATLEFLEKVTSIVANGDSMDAVFLDFVKALDKVPHKRLLAKLRAHGVTGRGLEWIKSWQSDRRQCVVLNRRSLGY